MLSRSDILRYTRYNTNQGSQPMSQSSGVLSQDFELGFTYTRSTGPVVGKFLTALKNRQVIGNRGSDGQVYVPPAEFDAVTAEPLADAEFVELGETGTVKTWVWVHEPREKHPLDKPFAFALITMDGADVPMLHMVDAGSESAMSTGMKVKVRWVDEPRGLITDIACFVPA